MDVGGQSLMGTMVGEANEIIARYLSERDRKFVFEFGIGSGELTAALHRYVRRVYVHGVDLSAQLVRNASSRYGSDTFAVHDLREPTKFNDGFFDAAAGTELLVTLEDEVAEGVLKEMARLIPPKGLVLFSELTPESFELFHMLPDTTVDKFGAGEICMERLANVLAQQMGCSREELDRSFPLGTLYVRRPERYAEMIEAAGLRVESVLPVPPPTTHPMLPVGMFGNPAAFVYVGQKD